MIRVTPQQLEARLRERPPEYLSEIAPALVRTLPGGVQEYNERHPAWRAAVRKYRKAAHVPGVARKPCSCSEQREAAKRIIPYTREQQMAQTPPVRPSCLECVEKHLGAAWVLLAEARDGYATRLRAIGHLHEAEDESQAWPELHNAIRDARKAYQQTGTVPDFEALARLVATSRKA
jgi:hypothetical protein